MNDRMTVQKLRRLVTGLILTLGSVGANATVRVYPAPSGEPLSGSYTVSVENQNVAVYAAKSNVIAALALPAIKRPGMPAFASFDMSGSVAITVTVPGRVQSAKVLPSSSGINPSISGNRVSFTVTKPAQLTLEINGNWMDSLHLFANPLETAIPQAHDPNVIYFGPGIHTITPLKVGSGKTVYIAGGAVIYGKLGPTDKEGPVIWLAGSNITLRGRGIIDGSLFDPDNRAGNIVKVNGSNIHVEGVVLRDSSNWTLPVVQSRQVTIDNVKILGSRDNSDGVDIVNSQDVAVSNGFIRTFDDLVVVKTLFQGSESRNITVQHMVLWNEIAHALTIGSEVRENIEDVTFSDCDIIHDKGREWLLRVFNSGPGTVSHVLFADIRIEEARRVLSLWVGKNQWSQDAGLGSIQDITFRNIRSPAPEDAARSAEFIGGDAQHGIREVLIQNVVVGGRPFTVTEVSGNHLAADVRVQP